MVTVTGLLASIIMIPLKFLNGVTEQTNITCCQSRWKICTTVTKLYAADWTRNRLIVKGLVYVWPGSCTLWQSTAHSLFRGDWRRGTELGGRGVLSGKPSGCVCMPPPLDTPALHSASQKSSRKVMLILEDDTRFHLTIPIWWKQ